MSIIYLLSHSLELTSLLNKNGIIWKSFYFVCAQDSVSRRLLVATSLERAMSLVLPTICETKR